LSIIYGVRLREFGATDASSALVQALPRTPLDFWAAYDTFSSHSTEIEQRLSGMYQQYWQLAARAIRHGGKGYDRYLAMYAWIPSGEMLDLVTQGTELLRQGSRAAYNHALWSVDEESRARICDLTGTPCPPHRKNTKTN
jgi:hypothetical protein